ncbi:MAG: protein-glutamate O-methyltransferase CheR [Planctomycetota bacterium]|nr:protein-glutamate O-methyltransferase CheR [Planctomycetota bacterium]
MESLKLTPDQFTRMARLVYERTGIHMPEEKLSMLSNRLRNRLRALKFDSFDEYCRLLESKKGCDQELLNFLSVVTTNETYFFRNEKMWKFFSEDLIRYFAETKSASKSIRIWSAASSSGEEAYTAAIALRENLKDFKQWRLTIIGSDISRNVLDKASAGVYDDYAVSKMSPTQVRRWFSKKGDEYHLCDEIRGIVAFQFHNLRDAFPSAPFDLVFLRNVLMYFDTPMKQRVLKVVTDAVAPGGHMIVGDVDPIRTLPELSAGLTMVYKGPGVYRKPVGKNAKAGKGEMVSA